MAQSSVEQIQKCIYFPPAIIPDDISLPDFIMDELQKYGDRTAMVNQQ